MSLSASRQVQAPAATDPAGSQPTTNPYPDLAAVLTAPAPSPTALGAAPPISLATATRAVGQAMDLVDKQLAVVQGATVVANFTGAAPMVTALGQMKDAAARWTGVKRSLQAAARSTVNAESAAVETANACENADADAASLALALTRFAEGTLQELQSTYQLVQSEFDEFAANLASVETSAGAANAQAVQALDASQADIQSRVQQIKAQENDMQSAASIILDILSCGVTAEIQFTKLQNEMGSLQDAEQQQAAQQQAYAMAYAQFTNAANAEVLAVQALATVNTALEQAVNTLMDVNTSTSGNLEVMRVWMRSFLEDFEGAVEASETMLS